MFQKIWSNISQRISEHFEKKRQIQEEFEQMQRQAEFSERIALEQDQKKKNLEEARRKALEDFHNKTGIQKLQALNRLKTLENNTDSVFSKLSQHTQRNLKRTEENKKRNMLVRQIAQDMRNEKLRNAQLDRLNRIEMNRRRGFIK